MVGATCLAAHPLLADLHHLPRSLLIFMGLANLLYGSYSLSLAVRRQRSLRSIQILCIANLLWAPICFSLAAIFRQPISVFGLVHLIGEGLYVGGLGFVEWQFRYRLTNR